MYVSMCSVFFLCLFVFCNEAQQQIFQTVCNVNVQTIQRLSVILLMIVFVYSNHLNVSE